MKRFYQSLINTGNCLQPFLLLMMRLYWGYAFFSGGMGKLYNIERITGFFESLGIPFPMFNAYLVGGVETICGLCLLFGLASRLITVPLIITMVVALLTAHSKATFAMFQAMGGIHQNLELFMTKAGVFVKEEPINFLIASLMVFCFGPGGISADFVMKKLFFKR